MAMTTLFSIGFFFITGAKQYFNTWALLMIRSARTFLDLFSETRRKTSQFSSFFPLALKTNKHYKNNKVFVSSVRLSAEQRKFKFRDENISACRTAELRNLVALLRSCWLSKTAELRTELVLCLRLRPFQTQPERPRLLDSSSTIKMPKKKQVSTKI